MRYLGNKNRLLDWIASIIEEKKISGSTFADLFAGTGAVGDFFKDKYSIIANDFLYSSYVINKAKLMNNKIPEFEKFYNQFGVNPFDFLNSKFYTPNDHYFIYNNYSPKGGRGFFTEKNALKIDGIRIDIESFYLRDYLCEGEYYYLLASLIESVTKISNTSGTYEAFFNFWESRSLKDLFLLPLEMKNTSANYGSNFVFNMNTNELVKSLSGDIAYIDTPYTITQYSSAYHLLETIAKYDFPNIKGKTGRRQDDRKMSDFSRKQNAFFAFEDLLRKLDFEHIIISYSSQSLIPVNELIDLAKLFSVDKQVYVERKNFREYKNLNSSLKGNGNDLEELIIYFRKDRKVNKSPINYSGSKNEILNRIINELPEHVGTFVDAMGGAFNVGANIAATKKVIYNEYNPYIFSLVELVLKSDRSKLVEDVKNVISRFQLDNGRREEYTKFREHYNSIDKSALNLFVLHMYSFQNLVRFNSKQYFNTPVGNCGFNANLADRILNFYCKADDFELYNLSYKDLDISLLNKDTLFYFDPPYFLTTAEYNDGKRGFEGWDADSEAELLEFLTILNKKGFKFILSNVIEHGDKINYLLREWIENHRFETVYVGKAGKRYPRVEVLVKNF